MKANLFILLMIFGLVFTSCEDWLKVDSDTELSQDDMFSSDEGFQTALMGIYIGMTSTDLYGMHLSWHMLDYLAHYYCLISGSDDTYLHSHQYKHANVYPYVKGIWNGLYNLIANCNNMLQKLEEHKSELNPINYQLLKGEALTLRAFFHFDLMRLFGYGNLRERDMSSKKAIPYVTKFTKEVTPQLSYAETFKLLKKDLLDAIDLLYGENGNNCYRITGDDDFFDEANGDNTSFFTYFDYETCPRIDYYVAKAILARVYMWEGTDEGYAEAVKIAEEWFLTEDDAGQDCWDWVSTSRVTNANVNYRDRTFSQEHIWHLSVAKLNDIIGDWLDASNPNATYERVFLIQEMAFSIFEVGEGNDVGVGDYRFSYLLQPQGSGLNNYATLKMDQCEGETNYGGMIPLISTPEMYYICAEVYAEQGDLEKAVNYLNIVRRARGIMQDLDENKLTYQEVKEEILKEYRKEFVSLGQLFYFYKRWGVENVVGYADIMDDSKYILPYPDEEVISGNRVQF